MGSLWRWQFRERAMLHNGLRSVWRIGWIGWAVNEPAILALAQEIRRLRREGSITIFLCILKKRERSRATILMRAV